MAQPDSVQEGNAIINELPSLISRDTLRNWYNQARSGSRVLLNQVSSYLCM